MFYLLEDNRIINRIIDSENLRKDLSDGTLLNPVFDIKKEKNKVHYYFEGLHFDTLKIIKQSENVFDLIEEGDLVKDDNCLYEVGEISDGKNDNGRKSAISQPGMFKHWEWKIEAIYKPNEKGDYIKVWEKKDDK